MLTETEQAVVDASEALARARDFLDSAVNVFKTTPTAAAWEAVTLAGGRYATATNDYADAVIAATNAKLGTRKP